MAEMIQEPEVREDDEVVNQSGKRPFQDVLSVNLNRRGVLKGGLAGATAFVAPSIPSVSSAGDFIGFRALPKAKATGPWPTISADYEWNVLAPWGDPIEPSGPAYNYPPSAKNQALQMGGGHDGMWFFGRRTDNGPSNTRGVMCINHEFITNSTLLGYGAPGSGNSSGALPRSLEDVRTSQHAHGVSVIEVAKRGNRWVTLNSPFARRVHVNPPVEFTGPAADSELLQTPNGNVPLGTVNNCGNGYTPWGTYLTCEENFNGYFGATNANSTWIPSEEQARYGFSSAGFNYGWYLFDRRFDLSDEDYRNEENRFGWIVEIDPFDPDAKPKKRTALGRVKHEGIALTIGKDGRAVGYMGDDQRFDYIYKFVSSGDHRDMLAQGMRASMRASCTWLISTRTARVSGWN
ncbi:MAG: alkaline phosphatase PhoX [Pseudomonadota bacterium]